VGLVGGIVPFVVIQVHSASPYPEAGRQGNVHPGAIGR
jgi:hypothetical protein